ncbi:MAG: response regulator transcription factor [Planctomycetaceae bacterium]|jgi:DNA-binding NarL/FixJ family response regulator|nr:response regulator transcription factor [Planctomycetaceae bacterium]
MDNKPSLIIIENRVFVREYIKKVARLLKPVFKVVIFHSISEVLVKCHGKRRPDIIVLGVGSFVFAEESVTSLWRVFGTQTSIILFDAAVNYAIIRMVLCQKLGGYLSFFNSLTDFCKIIKLVHEGKQAISQAEGEIILFSEYHAHEQLHAPNFFQLSQREYELFRHIVNGDGFPEISQKMGITAKSVENIKTRLMQKLNVHSTSKLILVGIRYGLGAR